jgi:branched-chain amino acid transport system permease protein
VADIAVERGAPLAGRRKIQLPIVDGFLWAVRVAAVVLIVWGAFNSLTSGRLSFQQWRDLVVIGIAQGSVYAMIALGYTMVYGVLRFINFAHGEVFMIGAMTGVYVSEALARTALWESAPFVALFIALVCCMAVSTLVALLLERVCYRPLRGMPRLVPFITAIGASFFLQYTMAGLFGVSVQSYPAVDVLVGEFSFLGLRIQRVHLVVIVAAVSMMAGLYLFVEKTKAGRAMRAVAEDQETARLMGINVDRTIALVFGIGGAMAGAAGLLYGLAFRNVHFLTGFLPGIKAFTAAVLGGVGNLQGAFLGGLLIGVVAAASDFLFDPRWTQAVVFGMLILILVFKPTGLLGEATPERA